METDLLVNPKMMGGMTNLESVELPTLDFNDIGGGEAPPPPPQGPRLVPTIEETGPTHMGGMANLNAEPYMTPAAPARMSDDHVMREKYDMLRKFERLGKMGVPMRKRFTIDSPMEEMKLELEFIKREKSMDATIKQFSEWFVTGMSAAEWGSKNVGAMKAFGLQLDGLSEAAQMNVVDLEDDFEELYDLYGENMKMHPLVRIPLRVCMMVYMVHLTNQMAQKAPIPNIQDIMRQNPDIARQLAGAAMQNQAQQMRSTASVPPPASAPNPLAGLMSFMQQSQPPAPPPNLVPKQPAENKPVRIGVQQQRRPQAPAQAPAPPPAASIRPPPNIDDLLKDIKASVSNGPQTGSAASVGKKGRGSTGKSVKISL
jgi:hypothetical protein